MRILHPPIPARLSIRSSRGSCGSASRRSRQTVFETAADLMGELREWLLNRPQREGPGEGVAGDGSRHRSLRLLARMAIVARSRPAERSGLHRRGGALRIRHGVEPRARPGVSRTRRAWNLRRRVADVPVRILEGSFTSQSRTNHRHAKPAKSSARMPSAGESSSGSDTRRRWRRGSRRSIGSSRPRSVRLRFPSPRIRKALLELVRKIPLDSPRQIDLLGSKAEEIADLVTTLVGLAQIRAGQYTKASSTLAALKTLTPGSGASTRDSRSCARTTTPRPRLFFRQVLAEDPKHSGARLGILVSRSAKTFDLGDEESRED